MIVKFIKCLIVFFNKRKLFKHKLYVRYLINRGLRLGKNVTIGSTASIDDEYAYLISIGDNCTISNHVRIIAHDASLYKYTDGYTRIGKVEIKDNCYFGEKVIILPGVTIGPNVLVAAGSVVNKDIPPNSCVAGVPARFYAKFDDFLEKHKSRIKKDITFKYEDLFNNKNKEIKERIIEKTKEKDCYIHGFAGRFPTTFNE